MSARLVRPRARSRFEGDVDALGKRLRLVRFAAMANPSATGPGHVKSRHRHLLAINVAMSQDSERKN
jgi:hypothetical protein